MAGPGAPPKDPSQRARRNHDPIPTTLLRADFCKAPPLPKVYGQDPQVRRWWRTWVASPQAERFTSTDWQFMLDTLPIVAAYYDGDLRQAAEMRLRMAKFGATPEDRARLRMQFAQADDAESRKPVEESAGRSRFAGLRAVGGRDAVAGA